VVSDLSGKSSYKILASVLSSSPLVATIVGFGSSTGFCERYSATSSLFIRFMSLGVGGANVIKGLNFSYVS